MKIRVFSGMGVGLLVASLLVASPVVANGDPEPDAIVSCDVGGADLRGSAVCYLSASLTRSGTPLTLGTQFGLFYQDESEAFGEGSGGFVVRVGLHDGDALNPFEPPLAGDVAVMRIAYPVVDRDPSGDTEGLRGTDVAAGLFAIASATDFSYTKSLETSGPSSWVEFSINKTFVETWFRQACTFVDFDADTGYAIPPPECEVENGGLVDGVAITSSGDVTNGITFYTPATFDGFVNSTTDGGYLNYQGTGLTWFTEGGNFEFQIIGPSYASGSTLNSGALQAFLPQAYMLEVFGPDFSPSSPVWEPTRLDASGGAVTAQDLSNQVVASARNDGLLIELASYQFSAPVFSFGPVISSTSASSGGSGGSGVPGIFLTVAGHAGRDVQGSPVYYGADRVALESSYLLTVSPAGRSLSFARLAEGIIETNGSFSGTVRLPALRDGSHEVQLSGRHRNGATLELTATLVVRDGKIVSVGPNVPIIR